MNASENTRLDDDDLETILTIARNGQSGRITEREIRELVSAYRALRQASALAKEKEAS